MGHSRANKSSPRWEESGMPLASGQGGDRLELGRRELPGLMANVLLTDGVRGVEGCTVVKAGWKGGLSLCISLHVNFALKKKKQKVWIVISGICVWEFRTKCTDVCDLKRNVSKLRWMAPGSWLSWLERGPIQQKVVGSIPGGGVDGRQPISVSLPRWCFSLPVSLSLSPHLLLLLLLPSSLYSHEKQIPWWRLKE